MSDDKTRISQRFAGADVGTQLSGIYELDARIATGGMGEVYRGHNIQTGDTVAIKIVLPEFAHDQTILSLFRKEASILNHLSHDAVVRYHVFTIDPGIGRPYLAMEFVDGESLFDVLGHGAMPPDEVCKLCHRLTSGLSAVHAAGAIHRDLSPDNIILPGGRVERAKIIDFGIARSEAVGGGTLIDGKFAGKYNYVSPEQLGLFGGQVTTQSDIYSLGLVLAAALRGKPIDMSGTQLDVVEKRRAVPDLSDIDIGFRPLLDAMLQPLPANRPQSMTEIAGMTRDGVIDISGPHPPVRHDDWQPDDNGWRGGEPSRPPVAQPAALSSAGDRSRPPGGTAGPAFVEHVRPSHLSAGPPRMSGAPAAAASSAPPASRRPAGLVAAAASLALVVAVAGAYWGGFIGAPGRPASGGDGSAALTPAPRAPTDGTARPQASVPQPNEAANAAPGVAASPDAVGGPAQAAAPPPVTAEPAEASAAAKLAEALARKPASEASGQPAARQETVPPAQSAPAEAQPHADTTAPKTVASAGTSHGSEVAPTAPVATAPGTEPGPGKIQPAPSPQPTIAVTPTGPPPDVGSPPGQASATVAEASPPAQPSVPVAGDTTAPGADTQQVVALTVPKPEMPAGAAIDIVAQRVAWLRAYQGGDCFYASAIAATDKSIEIEGFGTAVDPFARMESAFEAKFDLEPEIAVRLIEASQCQVVSFLTSLAGSGAKRPELVLDRTSIPNGSALSGVLRTEPGLKSSMLLIDHKGMMFNLDDRVVVAGNQATFNIPIGLGASDRSLGKPVPQIVLVITGPRALAAAEFSTPVRADETLPRIRSEIRQTGGEFSATAKYFRLGG